MDPITQQRLAYLLFCTSEPLARQLGRHFEPVINPNNPLTSDERAQATQEAQQIISCVYPQPARPPSLDDPPLVPPANPETVQRCFRQVLQARAIPNLSQLFATSPWGSVVCSNLTRLGDRAYQFHDGRQGFDSLYNSGRERLASYPERDRQVIEGVHTFYSALLDEGTQMDYIRRTSGRTVPEELQQRMVSYNYPASRVETLNPRIGRDAQYWERHDITIEGARYRVPVLLLRSEHSHWSMYERQLSFCFDLFRLFITPENLNSILRPGGVESDFIFVLVPNRRLEGRFLSDAMLSGGNINRMVGRGLASPFENYIWIGQNHLDGGIGGSLHADGTIEIDLGRFITKTFFHEFAHHIDFYSFTHADRENLETFRQWMLAFYNGNSANRYVAPEPLGPRRTRPYALNNTYELWAEMASDYMAEQTRRYLGAVIPAPDDSPASRHRQARLDLMAQFFSRQGMRREVFNPRNIEATYRRHGISMNLGGFSSPTWTIEPRAAFQCDNQGRMGGEASILLRTMSARHPNFHFGLEVGTPSPEGNAYLLGELGLSNALAPVRLESYVLGGLDLGSGNGLFGLGSRLSFFPSGGNAGWNLTVGGRAVVDTSQSDVTGLVQFGLGYVPRNGFSGTWESPPYDPDE